MYNQYSTSSPSYYRAHHFGNQADVPTGALKNRDTKQFVAQIPHGREFFEPTHKKHYENKSYKSEIEDDRVFKEEYPLEEIEKSRIAMDRSYFRSLNVDDIEGAKPNTLISKAVKNKNKAHNHFKKPEENEVREMGSFPGGQYSSKQQQAAQLFNRNKSIMENNSIRILQPESYPTSSGINRSDLKPVSGSSNYHFKQQQNRSGAPQQNYHQQNSDQNFQEGSQQPRNRQSEERGSVSYYQRKLRELREQQQQEELQRDRARAKQQQKMELLRERERRIAELERELEIEKQHNLSNSRFRSSNEEAQRVSYAQINHNSHLSNVQNTNTREDPHSIDSEPKTPVRTFEEGKYQLSGQQADRGQREGQSQFMHQPQQLQQPSYNPQAQHLQRPLHGDFQNSRNLPPPNQQRQPPTDYYSQQQMVKNRRFNPTYLSFEGVGL